MTNPNEKITPTKEQISNEIASIIASGYFENYEFDDDADDDENASYIVDRFDDERVTIEIVDYIMKLTENKETMKSENLSYLELQAFGEKYHKEMLEGKKSIIVGNTYYYNRSTNGISLRKVVIKNIFGDYANYCECEQCKARIGTADEYMKFDNAIHVDSLYETIEELSKSLHEKLDEEINCFIKNQECK